MEGFQRKLLSVHLGMGRIQTGKEEVLPTCAQGTFQTVNPVKARASCFIPIWLQTLHHIVLTSDAGAFAEGRAAWKLGKISSVPALKLHDLC